MIHLTLEALARLVDEPPEAAEARHLEACAACRRELETLGEDVAALNELPDLLPPRPGAWPALEERLVEEGLLGPARRDRLPDAGRILRLAASLALFLLGGASGFLLRGEAGFPFPGSGEPRLVGAAAGSDPARSLEEAEAAYLATLARYAELSAPSSAADPVARLAALDNIVQTTREALNAAPADPVINGYHLTALAQREATMKQIVLASDDKWY